MAEQRTAFERAMMLAAVSGLKTTFGPALIMASSRKPGWKGLLLAAMGEMVVDKLPFVPSRSRLPLMIPRALAGYWAASEHMKAEGVNDPSAGFLGAALAAGVATFAPMVRGTVSTVLNVPDPVVGVAEDALALYLGAEAAGMSMDELGQAARDAIEDVAGQVAPMVEDLREQFQSATA
jgi:hypothetical protein